MQSLSVCAGIGGFDLGLRLAIPSARTVCYVERDSFAAAVLVARMLDGCLDDAPIWDDVGSFDGGAWRGKVDCVTAGFPCQPFSAAGKRLGTEDVRWIWPHVERCIRDTGCELVLLENVPPLTLRGLDLVLRGLAVLGFDAEWDLFSAASVGAPHLRERIFILAHRDGPRRARERLGELLDRERQAQRGDADGCGALADPERVDLRIESGRRGGESGPGEAGPGDTGAAVADADDEQQQEAVQRDGGQPRNAGCSMGNTTGGPPAGGRWAERDIEAGEPWPPGLGDSRWSEVPDDDQPALRRVADGSPAGLFAADRLRVLGNGVIPVVVAHALRTLAARAGIGE